MVPLYPLRFQTILRQYLWGGRRLETSLGKTLESGDHWAESWEVSDHGQDQSVVAAGPLAGTTLGQIVNECGEQLLGRHYPLLQFPLLMKFLDAREMLSVQVHPDDARAARLDPPDSGKTETWYVLEAEPGSLIYAGLKSGIDREGLAAAIREGRCQECLHAIRPSPGDCFFLPAGTVHSLGAGLLVAEIQQSSDVTYRLYDWDRIGPDGKKRELHVEQALECIDFARGPVEPQRPRGDCPNFRGHQSAAMVDENGTVPFNVQAAFHPQVSRLVECEKFVWDRWEFDSPQSAGGDDRCHIITILKGAVEIEGDPSGSVLSRGGTALLPASLGSVPLRPQGGTILLDAYLP